MCDFCVLNDLLVLNANFEIWPTDDAATAATASDFTMYPRSLNRTANNGIMVWSLCSVGDGKKRCWGKGKYDVWWAPVNLLPPFPAKSTAFGGGVRQAKAKSYN